MDESQVMQVVKDNCRPLASTLGVGHWDVTFKCEHIGDETANGFSAAGKCELNPPYDSAIITVNPAEVSTDGDVKQVLRHEFIHILLAPFNLYRDFVAAMIDVTSPTYLQEDRLFHYAVEQVVRRIEELYDNMVESHGPTN